MKTIFTNLILIIFLCLSNAGYSQSLVIDFAKSLGGPKFDEAKNLHLDNYGNIYLTGSFRDTADFDPSIGQAIMPSFGLDDAFVAKFNAAGELIWAKQFGSSGIDMAFGVKTDASNNVIILGFFSGKADFNPGPDTFYLNSRGDIDIFVTKLNANGEFVWAKQFGGSKQDLCRTMDMDNTGNIYVGGAFYGKAFFGNDTLTNFFNSYGIRDICLFKLNNDGDLQWVNRIGADKDEACYGLTLDAQGNFYTTGYFAGTVDFDPGAGSYPLTYTGVYNAFVAKFNSDGQLFWAKKMGGSKDIYGRAIALDDSLNIYTTGQFRETVDFDPGADTFNLSVTGYFDIFVSKLNKDGNFEWAKTFGGLDNDGHVYGNDNAFSLAVDAQQQLLVAGTFWDTITYAIGNDTLQLLPKQDSNKDICILKYGISGDLLQVNRLAGDESDIALQILIDQNDNVFMAGHFTDDFYLDNQYIQQLTPIDSTDAFFFKYHYCWPSYKTIDTAVCNQYVAPGGTIFNVSGVYYDTLTNNSGCDSIVTIHFTINQSSDTAIYVTACDSYQWFDNLLDSSGIYYHTLTNIYSCDSVVTLNLTINHSSSSNINHIACDSYQWFGNVLDSTGTYYHTLANTLGCDSLITLNLTINHSSNSSFFESACVSYTWFDSTYYNSGVYTHTLTNAQNCDSIVTLNLTIHPEYVFNTVINACRKFVWAGNTYTTSGVYTFPYTSVYGCDSNYVIYLTVVHNDTTITVTDTSLIANINEANYQWIDCNNANSAINGAINQEFLPAVSGNYAVIISKNSCIDTSACYVFNKTAINEFVKNIFVLNPNPTNGLINITLPALAKDIELQLYDVTGKAILKRYFQHQKHISMNLKVDDGIYFLHITTDGTPLLPIKLLKTQ